MLTRDGWWVMTGDWWLIFDGVLMIDYAWVSMGNWWLMDYHWWQMIVDWLWMNADWWFTVVGCNMEIDDWHLMIDDGWVVSGELVVDMLWLVMADEWVVYRMIWWVVWWALDECWMFGWWVMIDELWYRTIRGSGMMVDDWWVITGDWWGTIGEWWMPGFDWRLVVGECRLMNTVVDDW